MKKICVVYRNRRNTAAIAWLDNCLKRVYEDYVDVEDCFMDELTDEEHLSADAFLVISSSLLPKLRRHTASLKNVVTMTRSVKKEYLPAILAIPTRSYADNDFPAWRYAGYSRRICRTGTAAHRCRRMR